MKAIKRISAPQSFNPSYYKDHRNPKGLLIKCRNYKKNFNINQPKKMWTQTNLASYNWNDSFKSEGDYFIINPLSKLPSWQGDSLSFDDIGLNPSLINILMAHKIIKPTNIQQIAMPTILRGYNTIIGGETGSGKSLAFMLPIINNMMENKIHKEEIRNSETIYPSSLVLAPSVELVKQLHGVSQMFVELNINSLLLENDIENFANCHLIFSTPMKMMNAIERGSVSLSQLKNIVFDEADILLDESFKDVTKQILKSTMIQTTSPLEGQSVGAQLILSNATWPKALQEDFGNIVPLESFNNIRTEEMERILPTVSHKFVRTTLEKKPVLLISLLKRKSINSIIFCNSVKSARELSNLLSSNSIDHECLFKSGSVQKRVKSYERFINSSCSTLVSTDLGSRGLDFSNIHLVVNYDMPSSVFHYLHRSGRVGRVGSKQIGRIVNLVSRKSEIYVVREVEASIRLNRKLIDTWENKD